jgi:hypothetical protein
MLVAEMNYSICHEIILIKRCPFSLYARFVGLWIFLPCAKERELVLRGDLGRYCIQLFKTYSDYHVSRAVKNTGRSCVLNTSQTMDISRVVELTSVRNSNDN